MAKNYKFTYFDARARGELARMVFGAAGQDYAETRVKMEEWPAVKPTIPTGQLPMLEVDGKQLSQSMAIARFLAREFGLAGKNSMEQALADQVVDTVLDLCEPYYKFFFEKDETKKEEAKRKILEETIPNYSKRLAMFLERNSSNSKYFVGDGLTIADLAAYEAYTSYFSFDKDILKNFPTLLEHRKLVESNPNVKKYLDSRPSSII